MGSSYSGEWHYFSAFLALKIFFDADIRQLRVSRRCSTLRGEGQSHWFSAHIIKGGMFPCAQWIDARGNMYVSLRSDS